MDSPKHISMYIGGVILSFDPVGCSNSPVGCSISLKLYVTAILASDSLKVYVVSHMEVCTRSFTASRAVPV